MKRMPSQFYIFAMAWLLQYWPQSWCFELVDPNADELLTALLLQTAFVIACNILISEPWRYAVILIEAFCMMLNVTLFLIPLSIGEFHAQIMLAAFIIELLIITISIQGAVVGRSDNYRLSLPSISLRGLRRALLYRNRGKRALSC